MESCETKVNVVAADLPEVKANVYALHVVIGLVGGKYPRDMISRFINECVDLKQDGLLDAKMLDGVQNVSNLVGGETYRKLVEHLTERIRTDEELAKGEEFIRTVAGDGKKATVEVTDKLPETAAEGDPSTPLRSAQDDTEEKEHSEHQDDTGEPAKKTSQKQAGVKTAERVAAAGKKTVAQARKKATGAADGK